VNESGVSFSSVKEMYPNAPDSLNDMDLPSDGLVLSPHKVSIT